MKFGVMIIVLALLCSAALASTTVIGRFTTEGGRDIGLITKYGEIWALSLDQQHPTVEIGKVVPSGDAYVGGYLSYWDSSRKTFAEPFALYCNEKGNLRFRAKAYAYLPLNGGQASIGSDEISLTYKISKNVRIGGLVNFWKQDGQDNLTGSGVQIECRLGPKTGFILRKTQGDLGQIRLAIFQTF